jgi:hypothetical protein
MSVYVDDAAIPYRRMKMCHLVADTIEELHTMAERLGLRRWFQAHASFPHYDICLSKRERAIELGAKPITRQQLVLFMRRARGQEIPEYLRDVELPA